MNPSRKFPQSPGWYWVKYTVGENAPFIKYFHQLGRRIVVYDQGQEDLKRLKEKDSSTKVKVPNEPGMDAHVVFGYPGMKDTVEEARDYLFIGPMAEPTWQGEVG